MSTEKERLIEIWLDNASEREYQAGFRSALIFSGHKVVHNTSHTAMELGKDVIAVAPDGEVIAYQLKGNPGGRITVSQWHELIPQINALVYQPIIHPNIKAKTIHQPILVTNGEIHEDVLAAIVIYNAAVEASGLKVKPLKTIARGELLSLFVEQAEKIWPVDPESQREILNLLACSGTDSVPENAFNELIERLLGLSGPAQKFKLERVAAAHMITTIIAGNWERPRNYFETIKLYVLLYVKISACLSQSKLKGRKANVFLQDIEFNIRGGLVEFVRWVAKEYGTRRPLLNQHIFREFSYFHVRKKMLMGLFAAIALDETLEVGEDSKDFLWDFVCKNESKMFLSGEFILPYCLTCFWAQSKIQGTQTPDRELAGILNTLLVANGQEEVRQHIPGPYYTLTEVIEWSHQDFLGIKNFDLEEDSHYRRAWFAEPIFYLLARRNWKKTCQLLWYELTKFLHTETKLNSPQEFGLAKSEEAQQQDKQIKIPQSWDDVVSTAKNESSPNVPPLLLEKPIIVLLYCLFVPYRMSYDVIMWLDRQFCKTWY
ncbi:MAG TPA: hypothetical protein VHD59_09155 [Pseudolabrys sp.]|nr:hypothetical protein [Pseudolabrys sp.]